ncbi:phycobilisome linker polypeptide [Pseudanabaena mucicola]|uniref:CpcD-like domain-containing protein n=1 Tax=Pseudanabaena mucicola FACHB-723 TaxID=2692860 RepID=A0ABR7ZUH2_9CYAN|nr:phycobilisome linker polypeptide [Pseudanabaena mucicola]MBD2187454.1 hypothetical protein [Pseudanabaena mucicola FACHB-723]
MKNSDTYSASASVDGSQRVTIEFVGGHHAGKMLGKGKAVYTATIPYSSLSQRLQTIHRSGGKITNVFMESFLSSHPMARHQTDETNSPEALIFTTATSTAIAETSHTLEQVIQPVTDVQATVLEDNSETNLANVPEDTKQEIDESVSPEPACTIKITPEVTVAETQVAEAVAPDVEVTEAPTVAETVKTLVETTTPESVPIEEVVATKSKRTKKTTEAPVEKVAKEKKPRATAKTSRTASKKETVVHSEELQPIAITEPVVEPVAEIVTESVPVTETVSAIPKVTEQVKTEPEPIVETTQIEEPVVAEAPAILVAEVTAIDVIPEPETVVASTPVVAAIPDPETVVEATQVAEVEVPAKAKKSRSTSKSGSGFNKPKSTAKESKSTKKPKI